MNFDELDSSLGEHNLAAQRTAEKINSLLDEMEIAQPPLGDLISERLEEIVRLTEADCANLHALAVSLGIYDDEGLLEPEYLPQKQKKPENNDNLDVPYEEVLKAAICQNNKVFLTSGKLKRECYEKVDRILRCLGGKWIGGKTQAHIFERDPAPLIEKFLNFGEIENLNPLAFFSSKHRVCQKIANWLRPENSHLVLDADAGEGAIASAVKQRFSHCNLHLVELDRDRAQVLREKQLGTVFEQDFLQFVGKTSYRAVVLNPPFNVVGDSRAYVTHIFKAWDLVESGGQLAAIAPLSFTFCKDKKNVALLQLIEEYGRYEELPPHQFTGTNIPAAILFLEKPHIVRQTKFASFLDLAMELD